MFIYDRLYSYTYLLAFKWINYSVVLFSQAYSLSTWHCIEWVFFKRQLKGKWSFLSIVTSARTRQIKIPGSFYKIVARQSSREVCDLFFVRLYNNVMWQKKYSRKGGQQVKMDCNDFPELSLFNFPYEHSLKTTNSFKVQHDLIIHLVVFIYANYTCIF